MSAVIQLTKKSKTTQSRGKARKAAFWFGAASVVAILSSLIPSAVRGTQGTTDVIHSSDAIVSLAPGQTRLPTARELMKEGTAPELVVSWSGKTALAPEGLPPEIQLEQYLCSKQTRQHVTCFIPQPFSTLGEALTLKELARERGWDSLTVVTSSYHVFRSDYIFQRCLPGISVHVVAAPTDLNLWEWIFHVAYENASFVKALVEVSAECP